MNYYELTSFILYFILVIGVGIYFFVKSKSSSEKDYFLGGRNMNGLVSALSAGASAAANVNLSAEHGSISASIIKIFIAGAVYNWFQKKQ